MRKKPAVSRHAKWILKMGKAGIRYKHIAARVHTNARHIRAFLHRNGIVLPPYSFAGANNPRWKGGRILDKSGYVLLYMPDYAGRNYLGYVREHRWVMENFLGRMLLPNEVVHHLNRDKQDNRIENLRLFVSNGAHLKIELDGKVPHWTRRGIARMRAGIALSAKKRRADTHILSARDVRQW